MPFVLVLAKANFVSNNRCLHRLKYCRISKTGMNEFSKEVRAQTRLTLDKIKKRLEKAGSSIDYVVKFVWYTAKREHKDEFIKARDEWLAEKPNLLKERSYASTLLVDVRLALPEMLVEVDAIAVIK